ncbi:MAG TPA: hypothetical protein VNM48_09525 [Chloroflexota bacterium]|nr:hypothetical protein [Chloroflexota bacterium]
MAEESAAAAATATAVAAAIAVSHAENAPQTAQTARARAERAARNDERKAERARQVREAEASLLQAQQRAAAEDAADDAADTSTGGGDEDERIDDDVHAILAQAKAEAAAAAVRIAQLEQRLLAAKADAPSQQRQKQQLQQQQHHQQQPQASSGGVHLQVKIDAVRVTLLEHTTAGQQLPNWLFSMEKLQTQIATSAGQHGLAWAHVFQLAQQHWDYDMNLWWTGREDSVRCGHSIAVSSWSGLRDALNADFSSGLQQEHAIHEMDGARQLRSDSVAEYLGRMAALYAKVRPDRVPSHVFAEKVLRGLDSARYPFGHTSVAAQQTARIAAHGRGFPFEVLRTMISTATMPEEQKYALHKQTQRGPGTTAPAGDRKPRSAKTHISAVRAAAAVDSDGRSDSDDESTRGSANHSERAEMRAQINALTRALAAASVSNGRKAKPLARPGGQADGASTADNSGGRARSKDRDDGRTGGQTRGGRCTKCGVKGHGRAECRSNKEVGCFGCGGDHLRRDCPGDDAEGQSASVN